MKIISLALAAATFIAASAALAQNYPAPREGDFIARDFKFNDGSTLPELRLHYITIGDPKGEPVIVLHGSGGNGQNFLTADFAGQLFGPGQPLDAQKYFIVLPDSVGAGKSSKPSDGLHAKFPRYDYDDMVRAQYLLLTQGLGIKHARLIMGQSMGGMNSWMWGEMYPKFMDALVPMACQPVGMYGRNWMTRRLVTEAIKRDPDWNNGDYKEQPRAWKITAQLFSLTTSGGTAALAKAAPNRETADKLAAERLASSPGDANDYLYTYDASRNYNPAPGLDKIEAAVLAINASDDERNPAELGVLDREIKRVKNGRYLLVPGGPDTRGHGTTNLARLYASQLAELLASASHRGE